MRRTGGIRPVWMTCLGAVIALFVLAPTGWAKGKPDLKPQSASLKGPPFAFIGERSNVTVKDVTANVGKGRAGPTLTRVYISRDRGDFSAKDELTGRAVGALGPREDSKEESDSRGRNRLKAGGYYLLVCVDAKDQEKESNETNNCGRVKPGRFYSLHRTWGGSLSGVGPGTYATGPDTTLERWNSTNASYAFDQYLGRGVFTWALQAGTVTYVHSGSNGLGCTYTGTGTFDLDRLFAPLFIDYENEQYSVNAAPAQGAAYTLSSNCDPVERYVFNALAIRNQKLTFGASSLAGAITDPEQPDTNYTWSFAGR